MYPLLPQFSRRFTKLSGETQCPLGTTTTDIVASEASQCVGDFDSLPDGICKVSPFFDDSFDECLMILKCRKQNGHDKKGFKKCVEDSASTSSFDFTTDMSDSTNRKKNNLHPLTCIIPAVTPPCRSLQFELSVRAVSEVWFKLKVVILHGAFSENKHGTSSLELRWPSLRCRRKDTSKSVNGRATFHIVIFTALHSLKT